MLCFIVVQRRHALRSYAQALQVYKGKDWSLAEVRYAVCAERAGLVK